MNVIDFASLGLVEPVLSAVRGEGYEIPTPIQTESIPALLAGRDLLGIAQTGTGKTAAFALPLIQRMLADPRKAPQKGARVLVVAPTRELAAQIEASFAAYGRGANLSRACVFGGVGSTPQEKALAKGVDVLVATPGRLLDLIDRGHITLSGVESVVLDEADRMFDMGFIRDVRRIVALLPKRRQTIFFSATMPPEIEAFADPLLTDPVRAAVPSTQPTADRVDQKVLFVNKEDKRHLLAAILKEDGFKRVIVFTKTKHGANRLVKQLAGEGIAADAIHANKSQNARTRTMDAFRSGGVDVLVATDLAARGIDVDDIELVVNFDLPNESETYIHRIGRTARAGADGVAVSFCDAEERPLLRDIERLIGFRIPVELDHPYRLDIEPLRDPEGGASRRPRAPSASAGRPAGNGARPRSDRFPMGGGASKQQTGGRGRDEESAGDRQPLTAESRIGLSEGGRRPSGGRQNTGRRDGGRPDAGRRDFGRPDVGRHDVGRHDVGRHDVGRRDAGRPSSGPFGRRDRGAYNAAPAYNAEPSLAELFSGEASRAPHDGPHGGPRPSAGGGRPFGRGPRPSGDHPFSGERNGADHGERAARSGRGGNGRTRPKEGDRGQPRPGDFAGSASDRPMDGGSGESKPTAGSGGRHRRRRGGHGRPTRPDTAPSGAE